MWKKLTITFFVLLPFVSCNKAEKIQDISSKTTDTVAIAAPDTLTEAEAWKLFDTFWVKFQSAVARGDTIVVNGRAISVEFDYFKDRIKKANKDNNYKDSIRVEYIMDFDDDDYDDNYREFYIGYKLIEVEYHNTFNITHYTSNTPSNETREYNVFRIVMNAQAHERTKLYSDSFIYILLVGLRNKKYEIIGSYDSYF